MKILRGLVGMVSRFKRANWAVADQAAISLSNFITVYLLARAMPLQDFGVFSLFFTAMMIAVALQNAIISQPHNVLGAKLVGQAYVQYTSALALLQLLLALAFGALAAMVGGLMVGALGLDMGRVIVVLGVAGAPWMTQEFVRRTFYTRSQTRAAFINDVLCYGLQLVGVAALVGRDALTTESVLLVMGGSSLIATALGAWQLRDSISASRRTYTRALLAKAWRDNWGFGRWLTARAALEWFRSHGHTWMLAVMLGPAAVGAYRAAYHFVNILNPIAMAVQSYLPSRSGAVLAEGGKPALARWLRRSFLVAGAAYSLIVVFVIAVSGQMLTLFYGDRFADISQELQWVIILSALDRLLRKFRYFPGAVLLVLERTRDLFMFDVISMVLLVVSSVVLIDAVGIVGAPLAKLVVAVILLWGVAWRARALLEGPATMDRAVAEAST